VSKMWMALAVTSAMWPGLAVAQSLQSGGGSGCCTVIGTTNSPLPPPPIYYCPEGWVLFTVEGGAQESINKKCAPVGMIIDAKSK
jgi:hypothetical protein